MKLRMMIASLNWRQYSDYTMLHESFNQRIVSEKYNDTNENENKKRKNLINKFFSVENI